MKYLTGVFAPVAMFFTLSASAAITNPVITSPESTEGLWSYSTYIGTNIAAGYEPTLAEFDGVSPAGYVDSYKTDPNGDFDIFRGSSDQHGRFLFTTYIVSDIDQTIVIVINGDDGHSLYADGVRLDGGGFGVGIRGQLTLHANTPVKLDFVGANSGGSWFFGLGLDEQTLYDGAGTAFPYPTYGLLSPNDSTVGIRIKADGFPVSPENKWKFSTFQGTAINSSYEPSLIEFDGINPSSYVESIKTDVNGDFDLFYGPSAPENQNRRFLYSTFIRSDFDQIVDIVVNGDDGHSLYIDGIRQDGGGFGVAARAQVALQANYPVKIDLVGANAGGTWNYTLGFGEQILTDSRGTEFHYPAHGLLSPLDSVTGIEMNADGFPEPPPEPRTYLITGAVLNSTNILQSSNVSVNDSVRVFVTVDAVADRDDGVEARYPINSIMVDAPGQMGKLYWNELPSSALLLDKNIGSGTDWFRQGGSLATSPGVVNPVPGVDTVGLINIIVYDLDGAMLESTALPEGDLDLSGVDSYDFKLSFGWLNSPFCESSSSCEVNFSLESYRDITDIENDQDYDGVTDDIDNCPSLANEDQLDVNADGFGDACVSPGVVIPTNAEIGENVILEEGVSLNKDSSIGDNTTVGENVSVGKGSSIGEETEISADASLSKETDIGDNVYIGEGVSIAKGVVIGADVQIGDNTTIRKDTIIGNNVVIRSNVLIERNVTVLDNAAILDGVVIPAGSTFPAS